MSDKKNFTGNFYGTGPVEETPEDCPSCLYPNKKVEKTPDDCPNCLYIPQNQKEQDQDE